MVRGGSGLRRHLPPAAQRFQGKTEAMLRRRETKGKPFGKAKVKRQKAKEMMKDSASLIGKDEKPAVFHHQRLMRESAALISH